MPFGMSIRIPGQLSPRLSRFLAVASSANLMPAAAVAGQRVLFDHLVEKESNPASHRSAADLGGKSSGLYAQMARATSWAVTGTGFSLTISHVAARQRYLGGTIRPSGRVSSATGQPIKHIAIPARGEAVGKTPSEFDLEPVFGRSGVYGLALAQQVTRQRKSRKKATYGQMEAVAVAGLERSQLMYWLVDEVTQAPDPTVLPTEERFARGILSATEAFIAEKTGETFNG